MRQHVLSEILDVKVIVLKELFFVLSGYDFHKFSTEVAGVGVEPTA